MKIALLNLPIDLNYGGNIQRFALSHVLISMGHDVEHIQLLKNVQIQLPIYKRYLVYAKRVLDIAIGRKHKDILYERNKIKGYQNVFRFYDKNVPHTDKKFYNRQDLNDYDWSGFDAFIVGSDQVWREDMTEQIGLDNYFFSFLSTINKIKIAYAVSFGKDSIKSPKVKFPSIPFLYKGFKAVSVREKSALEILENEGMNSPEPEFVLDPTLLLSRQDYVGLLKKEGYDNYCPNRYVLTYFINNDLFEHNVVREYADKKNLEIVNVTMDSMSKISIPHWIYLFMHAEYVFTDSYHGVVFSLLFNRPFEIKYNIHGGTSRIESLMVILGITDSKMIEWNSVNIKISEYRSKSLDFLRNSLNRERK